MSTVNNNDTAVSGGLILNIGDSENLCEQVLMSLAEAAQVIHCCEREEILRIAREKKPDLVMADLAYGGLDIWDICATIKKTITAKPVSFIFITGQANNEERMRSFLAGAKSYLEKPLDRQTLTREIKQVLNRSKAATRSLKRIGIKGNLNSMAITDLFQVIANYQKSGYLKIKTPALAKVCFREGEVVDADFKGRSGKIALYKIMSQRQGEFEFEERELTCGQTIHENWMSLAMEGARISDEMGRIRTEWQEYIPKQDLELLEELVLRDISSVESIIEVLQNTEEPTVAQALANGGIIEMEQTQKIYEELEEFREAAKNQHPTKRFKTMASEKSTSDIEIQTPITPATNKFKQKTTTNKAIIRKTTSIAKTNIEAGTELMRISFLAQQDYQSKAGRTSIGDTIFQRLLLSLSLITHDQLAVCVQEQVRMKLQNQDSSLPELLVSHRFVDEETIDGVARLENENGDSLIPGYQISHMVGEGGLAAVYLAIDLETKEKVAIKVFAPPMSDTSTNVVRFIRECEVTKTLEHPNIIKAYDFGEFHGLYYIIMEFVEGATLAQKIVEKGTYEEQEALEVIEKVLHALNTAWGQGFVHRDIKPGNLLVDENIIKVCDFGLAKTLDSDLQLTQAGTIVGTPHYMSPEQFAGEQLDYRTDVYSLGVTLFAMLTAHLPFAGTSQMALSQKHLNAPPPLPSKFHIDVSKPTIAFLFKLLSKAPEDRCSSPAELLDNLQRVKNGKMPKGGVKYFQKKRKKLIYTATIAGLIAIIAFSVMFYMEKSRVQMEQEKKDQKKQVTMEAQVQNRELLAEKNKLSTEEKRLQESQDKLAAEKKRLEKEQKERKKAEQQRLAREKKDREEREQKARLARENALKQDLTRTLENVNQAWDNLQWTEATAILKVLEQKHAGDKRLLTAKSIHADLLDLQRKLESGKNITSALKKVEKGPKNNILPSLLKKHLSSADDAGKKNIIEAWLQLSAANRRSLVEYIVEYQSEKWLTAILVTLPIKSLKIILPALKKKSVNYYKYIVSIRSLSIYLAAGKKAGKKLNKILGYASKNAIDYSWHHLDARRKHLAIKSIPYWFKSISPKNLSKLLTLIEKDSNAKLRKSLATELAKSSHTLSKTILRKMLEDSSNMVAIAAVGSLIQLQDTKGMTEALVHRDVHVRMAVIKKIENSRSSEHQKLMVRALSDEDSEIRERAVQVMGKNKVKASVAKLCQLLEDENPHIGKKAAWALGEIGSIEAVSRLADVLENTDRTVLGIAIIESLAKLNTSQAIEALVKTVVDGNFQYQRDATAALASAGIKAVPSLIRNLKKADSTAVRHIINVLEQIGEPAVKDIIALLKSSRDFDLKKDLIKLLGNIESAQAINPLIALLSERRLRRSIKKSLEKIANKLPMNDPRQSKISEALRKK